MKLDQKLKTLPQEPGVYLFKDIQGTIIYAGKAKNLKNRVSSYFVKSQHPIKTQKLIDTIYDFELILTQSETEALLLERTLIRDHRPRFNILLTDDKNYPFIRIDYREPWPRITKVRRRQKDDATYIGPFSDATSLSLSLKTVLQIFPIVRCSAYEFKHAKRPCNYYHMNLCLAPCTKPVEREDYIESIKAAEQLLRGQNKSLSKDLELKMLKASAQEHYEKAARLRDQINALQRLNTQQYAVLHDCEEADALATTLQAETLAISVLSVRNYCITGQQTFVFPQALDDPQEALEDFLLQYYDHRDIPQQLFIDLNLDKKIFEKALSKDQAIHITTNPKGEGAELLKIALKNADHALDSRTTQATRRQIQLAAMRKTLALENLPAHIECIDISNLQGDHIVASLVVFQDGGPNRGLYRHYNIKSLHEHHDDYASIGEVVQRRFKRAVQEGDAPDILVIDGGKGQLHAALQAAADYPEIKTLIISIAKSRAQKQGFASGHRSIAHSKERLFLPHKPSPLTLLPGDPVYRLITSIRDEAHRFAIGFHRKSRSKASLSTSLQAISGIGPKLEQKLLATYDLSQIKQMTLKELNTLPGVSKKLAKAIFDFFNASP